MASAFSHLLIGAAVGLIARPRLSAVLHDSDPQPSTTSTPQAPTKAARLHAALPWLCAVVAVVPDADVLAHAFVDYAHAFGHRGVFHSLLFYALLSVTLSALPPFRGQRGLVGLALFAALTSHSLLDMLTNGGLGIALFWPMSEQRLFFPWQPIPVSPLSVASFFSERGVRILSHELPYALPCFLVAWWWSSQRQSSSVGDGDGQRRSSGDPYEAADGPGASEDPEDDEPPDEFPRDDDSVGVLEITDSIDLHHFAPRDILSVVEAYLEAAWEKGFEEVRLIHGRGKGVQRARVQKLLSGHPLVVSYKDAPHTRGGWGATIAWLKPHPQRHATDS